MSARSSIPVTILGGWLGAGKTTLINRVLSTATERIAVIVNDVGEINIDAELLRDSADDDGIIELTNGCICCNVGDDLEETVAELALRSPGPERILIEASGVADLRPIAAHLDHPMLTLDAVIALAEPTGFAYRSSGPPYGSLMRAQLGGADLVIATKLDLVDAADRPAALDELRPFTKAPVVAAQTDATWLNSVILGAHANPDFEISHAPAPAVATRTWRSHGPVELPVLTARLRRSGLLRAKGSVLGTDGPVIVHLAGGRVDITPLDDSEPLNALVLIGESSDHVGEVAASLSED